MKDTTKQLQGHRSMTLVELAKQYVHRMSSEPRRRRQREEGFTLIELVIVLVVLGILSAIAVPQFTGMADQARLSAIASSLASANTINQAQCRILDWDTSASSCVAIEDASTDTLQALWDQHADDSDSWADVTDNIDIQNAGWVDAAPTSQGESARANIGTADWAQRADFRLTLTEE